MTPDFYDTIESCLLEDLYLIDESELDDNANDQNDENLIIEYDWVENNLPDLQLNIDAHVLAYGHDHVLLRGHREASRSGGDGVVPDSDGREGVNAGAVRGRHLGQTLVGIQECDFCAGNHGARSVLNHASN